MNMNPCLEREGQIRHLRKRRPDVGTQRCLNGRSSRRGKFKSSVPPSTSGSSGGIRRSLRYKNSQSQSRMRTGWLFSTIIVALDCNGERRLQMQSKVRHENNKIKEF